MRKILLVVPFVIVGFMPVAAQEKEKPIPFDNHFVSINWPVIDLNKYRGKLVTVTASYDTKYQGNNATYHDALATPVEVVTKAIGRTPEKIHKLNLVFNYDLDAASQVKMQLAIGQFKQLQQTQKVPAPTLEVTIIGKCVRHFYLEKCELINVKIK